MIIKANPPSLLSTVQFVDNFYRQVYSILSNKLTVGNTHWNLTWIFFRDRLCGEECYWWMQFVGAVEFIKTMEWAQQWLIHEWWIYQNNLIKNLEVFKIWWENKWSKWWFFGLCYKSWYKVRSDYNQHHMSWTERKNQHIRHKLESEQDDGQTTPSIGDL